MCWGLSASERRTVRSTYDLVDGELVNGPNRPWGNMEAESGPKS